VATLANLQYATGEVDYWLGGSARLPRTTAPGRLSAPSPLGVVLWWRLSALVAAWAIEQVLASGAVDPSPSWRALARRLRASGESLENLVPQVGSPEGGRALEVVLRAAHVVVPGGNIRAEWDRVAALRAGVPMLAEQTVDDLHLVVRESDRQACTLASLAGPVHLACDGFEGFLPRPGVRRRLGEPAAPAQEAGAQGP
jgi:hypothetical protein